MSLDCCLLSTEQLAALCDDCERERDALGRCGICDYEDPEACRIPKRTLLQRLWLDALPLELVAYVAEFLREADRSRFVAALSFQRLD